jgi:hypothetical protein
MLYIVLSYLYWLVLFILLPFYLIRGFIALISKDIQKRSRARRYFVISGVLFALAAASYIIIALFVQNLKNNGGVFL